MQDIKEVERAVLRLWQDQIVALLPQSAENEDESSQPESERDSFCVLSFLTLTFLGALRSALSSVTDFIPMLSSQVEAILTRRCCEALAPVKSLPGQFRATSHKHMPSKPSTFVPLILRPVKLFFGVETGEREARALRKDFCVPISTNIVESVSNKYV